MKCPYCGANEDRVVDSREIHRGMSIRRRRECRSCQRRFTSYERIEEVPFMVVKRDGTREAFDRAKLLAGLLKACEKRPVAAIKLEAIVDAVERKLSEREEREIATRQIGSMVMVRLRRLDPVAYVRFASVYRKFEDVGDFMDELRSLVDQTG